VPHGEGVGAAHVASPSTLSANSEAIVNGRLGVVVAGNSRVSPVNVFEDAQDMAVSRSVIFPHRVWEALRSRSLSDLMFLALLHEMLIFS